MARKKSFFIIFLILTLVFGCKGKNELNDLIIVLGMGIDKAESEENIELTIQAQKTTSEEQGVEKSSGGFLVVTAEGCSVFEAARNLTKFTSRRNYWPHTQVVVVSEKLAREGIISAVDFFSRDSQRRTTVYFIVTCDKAGKLLANPSKTEMVNSLSIKEKIKQTSSTGFGVDAKLHKFIEESQSVSGVSLLNHFELKKRFITAVGSPQKYETILEGTGVFFNYKLLGFLNEKETRSVNILRNKLKSTVVALDINDNGEKSNYTIEINKAKSKLKPMLTDDGYVMKADIILNGNIVEYSGQKHLEEVSLDMISKAVVEYISADINKTFDKAKNDFKVDLFGYGSLFSDKYPFILKMNHAEWNKTFVDSVELDLKVEAKIKQAGIRLNV